GPARTWPQGAHTGTATIGRRAGPRVRFAYPGYAAYRGDATPRSPDKAEGRIRVARGSAATRAQGPARTLPQGAHTGNATIGPHAGPRVRFAYPGYAAYRGDAAPRSPDKAEGRIRGCARIRRDAGAGTRQNIAPGGTHTDRHDWPASRPRVRFAYPGYASCCGIGDGGQRRPPCSRPGPRPYDAGLRRHARQWRACARLTPQGKRAQGRQAISARLPKACDRVPRSTYSSSPPSGRPWARRLGRTPCWRAICAR